ncbi:glycoside hydrolase family 3 protein [Novosphingopyxis sp.]|uniref:glycoside hydrolase family 3 protein n=1 Tax=Novosphingopyxis sp. TaxID=2709690 RepID=UPI003B5B9815
MKIGFLSAALPVLLAGCSGITPNEVLLPARTAEAASVGEWPRHRSPIGLDGAMEQRIGAIITGMTLEQKIGQMTQAEIRSITPEQVREYYIGSILNGGGAWPDMDKHAGVADWAALADRYYRASMATDLKVKIPVIWGTDAVHGHSNVAGATIFPHNIGLGAAHDPDLVMRIGRATAKATRATGITWVFAPTLAVVQNQRWGRSYESYSSDPELVEEYAGAMVRGLQDGLTEDGDVVATAKHFIGDGGTWRGVDRGENRSSLADMIAVHGAGYVGALDAGVQTVMASYNSWTDPAAGKTYGKMHGNRELLTGVLKDRMGFDGFVVSDWNAIEEVPGCTKAHCPQAINAGVDLVMVPDDWKAFIANTVADVRSGRIAMDRIDDAVRRILRVKMRSGLFAKNPGDGIYDGDARAIADPVLAREAVRKAVVLLKNDGQALPLARGEKLLVVGASANSFANQTGGWTLTWQGTDNVNADFTTGQTLLGALRAAAGPENIVYSADGAGVDPSRFAAVIAVLGETPYAETMGDVPYPAPLRHSVGHPEDLAVLERVSGKGAPVVTVLYSGRTTYANDLMNLSDAFVAAFLPGTEAGGIADLLLRGADGTADDFTGRLSFAWPASACPISATGATRVQFPRRYGLSYARPERTGALPVEAVRAECGTAQP